MKAERERERERERVCVCGCDQDVYESGRMCDGGGSEREAGETEGWGGCEADRER